MAVWIECPDCDEFWCLRHEMHASECPCPPIEEWDSDPYGGAEVKLETREVLAAAYLGPNKGRTMLTHSVEIGERGSVIRALCRRVSPLSIADHHAQDTTLEPTCPNCRSKKKKWQP
jgi:hypothetical protein